MIERKPTLVSTLPLSPVLRQMIADYESEPQVWKLGVIADWLTDNDPGSPLLAYMNAQGDTFHAAFANYGLKDWLGYIDAHQKAEWRASLPDVIDLCERCNIHYVDVACEYAEPGYTDPLGLILFANWNPASGLIPAKEIDPLGIEFDLDEELNIEDCLEALECVIEWSDEWATCCNCGRAVRTSPDCMSWHPHYEIEEHSADLTCLDCLNKEKIDE